MQDRYKHALTIGAIAAGALMGARTVSNRRNTYSFKGKVILITGGSRGLGLVMARRLADEGARLAICARDQAQLDDARTDLTARGAEVLALPCDVGDRGAVERMIGDAQKRYGRIDVLINNAGIIAVGPMETMRIEDYEAAMRTHFWGPLYTMLSVIPGMRERGEGRIVNISSIGGKISVPHLVPYSASKFALVGLSRGLRHEVKKDGITVTTVCPGLMRTGSPRNADFKGQNELEFAWFNIADSTPVSSMDADRAAKQVIEACRRGDAEIVLTTQAKVAAKLDALFPETSASLLALTNSFLPEPGGIGEQTRKGAESTSPASPSLVTAMGDKAAKRNNQIR